MYPNLYLSYNAFRILFVFHPNFILLHPYSQKILVWNVFIGKPNKNDKFNELKSALNAYIWIFAVSIYIGGIFWFGILEIIGRTEPKIYLIYYVDIEIILIPIITVKWVLLATFVFIPLSIFYYLLISL